MIAETCPTSVLRHLLVKAALAVTRTGTSGCSELLGAEGLRSARTWVSACPGLARLAPRERAAAAYRCPGTGKENLLTRRAL